AAKQKTHRPFTQRVRVEVSGPLGSQLGSIGRKKIAGRLETQTVVENLGRRLRRILPEPVDLLPTPFFEPAADERGPVHVGEEEVIHEKRWQGLSDVRL